MGEESERTRLRSENGEEGEGDIEGRRQKWLKHYSPHHQILLVGEGDFSFSSSLASAFGSASNVTATSLDLYDALIRKYKKAKSNLGNLKKLGVFLLHGVDATIMNYHVDLRVRKFDRIIFNFPHAGFHGREDDVHLISMHRKLMFGFFCNASQMLRADGEVHVRHKTNAPYCFWKLEELASWNSLNLIGWTAFESKNYPGYHHKRGDGSRCDELFPLGPCSTFKFRFYPRSWEVFRESKMHINAIHGEYWPIYGSPVQMPVEFPPIYERSVQLHGGSERIYENLVQTQEQSLPLSSGPFPSMTHVPLPRNTLVDLGMNSRNEYGGISAYHRNIMQEIPQRPCYGDVGFCSVPLPGFAFEPHYADVERRTSIGDLHLFQGPQHQENLRRLAHSFAQSIYMGPVQMPVEFPPIYERSVQVHGGSERIYENLVQMQERLLPLSFGPFPSMTHVPLPRNTLIELGMNSRNEYGGISAYHRNIMQEIPHRPCYDNAGFCSVPVPGLASEPHYADVERRTSVGDLHLFQGPQHQENLRRLIDSFARSIYVSPVQMPVEVPPIYERSVQVHGGSERIYENLVQTQERSLPLSFGPFPSMTHVSRNEYGGISAYHRNSMQEIPQRPCYDDARFCSVPLPGLASEPHSADVERRPSVGDLHLFQGPNIRRT
ncbi:hypothetical protein ACJRO7_023381 [Eucalyptus globulus]|uniref:25S rRNA (uridine-N(3))-methyltransferase BMT5-like domain-containing protein n=2 Tax=Eucalyptus globulus TaxID=34317 RepID=A0ABD3K653_EUCGL